MSPRAAIRIVSFLSVILGSAVSVPAAQLKEAQVTQVVKDVKLLPTGAAARPATVNDDVRDGIAVRTGVDSRSELKFTDQTLARLGANTLFSFSEGTRNLNLQDGAMLLRVPKGAGGAKINSSAVTAAITGTTVMLETHASTKKNKNSYYKFIVLEGTARLYLPGRLGESTLVKAGQMIIMRLDSKMIPEPVDVDIQKITQSSLLITGFGPLGSETLIAFEKTRQNEQKNSGQLIETNLVIYGGGTNVVLADPNTVDVAISAESNAAQSPTPPPTPPPPPPSSKFGALTVIASPDPFVINSGTTIQTDPSITTNGVTDFGKIYRGPVTDGPASAWAFGSTSTFDTSSAFDSQINTSGAAFKFTALQLTGDPTISTANGEINLGLIAVNGITSGSPGGPLTFSGIRGLLLATQNGPINLGPEISFSGLHDLTIYARGPASDLLLGSDISTTGEVHLYAERDMSVTSNITTEQFTAVAGRDITINAFNAVTVSLSAANNLNWSGGIFGATAVNSDGNVGVSAGNQISITNGLEIDRTFGDQSSGLNVSLNATASDITVGNSLIINVDNSVNGNLDSGANITLNTGGNLAINGGGGLSLIVANNDGGHIGTGGNVFVAAGGNLSANSINALINNRNGGSIDSGALMIFNVGGALTTQGDATFGTSTRNDGSGGGSIASDAIVTILANSISVSGELDAFLSANGGGHIGTFALIQFITQGDLHSGTGTFFDLEATAYNTFSGPFLAPGIIGTDALINVSAGSVSSDGFLEADIFDRGGQINGNAGISFIVSGDVTSHDDAVFNIGTADIPGGKPGTIGGDASILLNATNLSVNGTLDTRIDNTSGTIHGNASMIFNTTTALTSTGDQLYQLINADGGTIGGSATLEVTTKDLSSGRSLFVGILNSTNDGGLTGTVASNATLNLNVSGTATVATDATFQINGSDSAASSTINFNGGTYNVGGKFVGFMDGSGTMTFNNASVHANVLKAGVFGTNGVLNIGGGTLSADTTLKLYANSSNGTVNFIANVMLTGASSKIIAGDTVKVFDNVVVTIGMSPADIYTNHAHYSSSNGGDGTTTGIFIPSGFIGPAVTTHPGATPPPFDDLPPPGTLTTNGTSSTKVSTKTLSTTSGTTTSTKVSSATLSTTNVTSGKKTGSVINVSDSGQLLSLLDGATPGPNGKVRVSPVTRSRNAAVQGSTRTMVAELHRSVDARARSGVLASRFQ